MRLDAEQRQAIRDEVDRAFGPRAAVRVFGSRLRKSAAGGDVDLFVELPEAVEQPAWRASLLEARLMRRLSGRRVDVVLAAPNVMEQPIHRVARSEGVRL